MHQHQYRRLCFLSCGTARTYLMHPNRPRGPELILFSSPRRLKHLHNTPIPVCADLVQPTNKVRDLAGNNFEAGLLEISSYLGKTYSISSLTTVQSSPHHTKEYLASRVFQTFQEPSAVCYFLVQKCAASDHLYVGKPNHSMIQFSYLNIPFRNLK